MKISLNSHVSRVEKTTLNKSRVSCAANYQGSTRLSGSVKINFRGGNKEDVLHVLAELPPYYKVGGVGTVAQDYTELCNVDSGTKGRSAFVIPYYNGKIKYDSTGSIITGVDVLRVPDKLPDNHSLKGKGYEGKPFFTSMDLDKNSISNILSDPKNYTILEEVKTTKNSMHWGLDVETPIKLFRVPGTNHFMVFTDMTASMKKPYSDGSYSSSVIPVSHHFKGTPYAKFDCATVELMEDISSAVGNGFDPGTVVCSDAQAAPVSHYMALKNSQGIDYFKVKKPTVVGHNLARGYIGEMSPREALINSGLDKVTLERLLNSKQYHEALLSGQEDKFILDLFAKVFGGEQKQISAMQVASYYAKYGYVPTITTVSDGYAEACVSNPAISPLQSDFRELKSNGRFSGIINPLNDSRLSPFNKLPIAGYADDVTIDYKGETKTFKAFLPFNDTVSKSNNPLIDIRMHKKTLKQNLFERLSGAYNDFPEVIAGKKGAKIKVHGKIDPKFGKALGLGEDVITFVSWGRLDFQKSFEEVIDGFAKFKKKNPNTKAVLIFGGPETAKVQTKKLLDLFNKRIKDKDLSGSMVFLEGFTPGHALARAADMSIFPSRFAPCELTDLESIKQLCIPLVSNCQGLAQKITDPLEQSREIPVNGYKTVHEYFMPLDEALKAANEDARVAFNRKIENLKHQITTTLQNRLDCDKGQIGDELVQKRLIEMPEYEELVKELKDSVMSDELASCMDRFAKDFNDESRMNQIYKNMLELDTSWEGNGVFSGNVSSAEQYRIKHFRIDGKDIKNDETILSKLKRAIDDIISSGDEKNIPPAAPASEAIVSHTKAQSFLGGKNKYIIAGFGLAAAAAIAFTLVINKKHSDKTNNSSDVFELQEKNNFKNSSNVIKPKINVSGMEQFMIKTKK